jgi:hypothetical protein
LAALGGVGRAAELWSEGGKPIVFLPGLSIPSRGKLLLRDALLWPHERDSYQSRLFLSEPIPDSPAQNWNQFSIAGRAWHACSWQGVANTLTWLEMLAGHLRAFR